MSTIAAIAIYLVVSWLRERQAKRRHAESERYKVEMRERINNIEEALARSPFVTFKPPLP